MPTETPTLLFTDIEGSTALFERVGAIFSTALALHHRILREAIEGHGGRVVGDTGDGLIAAFPEAARAVAAAIVAQQELWTTDWPVETGALRVRMGLHRGPVEFRDGDYHGLTMHHAARVMSSAHGMQILCSSAVVEMLDDNACQTRDLGLYRLKGITQPVRLFEVLHNSEGYPNFPPLNAPGAFTHSLPAPPTRYFGREADIEQLKELLAPAGAGDAVKRRLVTLLGPGGTGKTRLAIEVARRLLPQYSHAVWFVSLAELRDSSLLMDAIRDVLGLTPEGIPEPLTIIAEYLSAQPSLLILDNLEQLLPQAAAPISALLSRAKNLVCLVTSRTRVSLSSEQEFHLEPLSVPDADLSPELLIRNSAVRLFLDRAQAVRRDFDITLKNSADVTNLIITLEGIPLAIELAAARIRTLSAAQILRRMSRQLDVLSGGPIDAPERHRTLRSTIEWSYDLLTKPLQHLVARLSVFRGNWAVEAAEFVAASEEIPASEVLDALTELQGHSLIYLINSEENPRFGMFEVIREYAASKLGPLAEEAEKRHAEYFFGFCRRSEHDDTADWLRRIRADLDNVRAFLDRPGRVAERLRAAVWMYPYWLNHGLLREGTQSLKQLRLRGSEAPEETLAASANALAILHWKTGEYEAACHLFNEALLFWEKAGNETNMAGVLNNLAIVAADRGDFAQAQEYYRKSVEIYRRTGSAGLLAASLSNFGVNAMRLNQLEVARDLLDEAWRLLETSDDLALLANTALNIAELHARLGQYPLARGKLARSLDYRRALHCQDNLHICWFVMGEIAYGEGQIELAAGCWFAAKQVAEVAEERPSPEAIAELEQRLSQVGVKLSTTVYQRARFWGKTANIDGLIAPSGEWLTTHG